jgi:hypothetical protein
VGEIERLSASFAAEQVAQECREELVPGALRRRLPFIVLGTPPRLSLRSLRLPLLRRVLAVCRHPWRLPLTAMLGAVAVPARVAVAVPARVAVAVPAWVAVAVPA